MSLSYITFIAHNDDGKIDLIEFRTLVSKRIKKKEKRVEWEYIADIEEAWNACVEYMDLKNHRLVFTVTTDDDRIVEVKHESQD